MPVIVARTTFQDDKIYIYIIYIYIHIYSLSKSLKCMRFLESQYFLFQYVLFVNLHISHLYIFYTLYR